MHCLKSNDENFCVFLINIFLINPAKKTEVPLAASAKLNRVVYLPPLRVLLESSTCASALARVKRSHQKRRARYGERLFVQVGTAEQQQDVAMVFPFIKP